MTMAELIVARASRVAFEPLKRYTVADGATWAQPAISGERIFVKDTARSRSGPLIEKGGRSISA